MSARIRPVVVIVLALLLVAVAGRVETKKHRAVRGKHSSRQPHGRRIAAQPLAHAVTARRLASTACPTPPQP